MTTYSLQKLIREININPQVRARFKAGADQLVAEYELTDLERRAIISRDYRTLYKLGVHGLLLRPFSLIHEVSEVEYLQAIRGE